MTGAIHDVIVTPQRVIPTDGGAVLHAMKRGDAGYGGFGEAYFSEIDHGAVRAWKRHQRMTLNLVVAAGAVRFVIYDDRAGSSSAGTYQVVVLSRADHHARLTVPPMLWVGFQGASPDTNLLLNIANLPHDPDEADRAPVDRFAFEWPHHPSSPS